MDRSKIMLSILGLAALVVPAVLLIILTSSKGNQPSVPGSSRQINPDSVQDAVKKAPAPQPVLIPSPSPTEPPSFEESASPSASPESGGGLITP